MGGRSLTRRWARWSRAFRFLALAGLLGTLVAPPFVLPATAHRPAVALAGRAGVRAALAVARVTRQRPAARGTTAVAALAIATGASQLVRLASNLSPATAAVAPGARAPPSGILGAISTCAAIDYCGRVTFYIEGDGGGEIRAGSNNELDCVVPSAAYSANGCSYEFSWLQSQGTEISIPWSATADAVSHYCDDGASGQDCGTPYVTSVNSTMGVVAGETQQPIVAFYHDDFALTIGRQGTGTGTVHAKSTGNDDTCSITACTDSSVPYGAAETVTAAPDTGSVFGGWTGPCAGQGSTCNFTFTGTTTVIATFDIPGASATPKASLKPTATKHPAGSTTPAASAAGTPASEAPTDSADGSQPAGATGPPETPAAADSGPPLLVIGLIAVAAVLALAAFALLAPGRRGST